LGEHQRDYCLTYRYRACPAFAGNLRNVRWKSPPRESIFSRGNSSSFYYWILLILVVVSLLAYGLVLSGLLDLKFIRLLVHPASEGVLARAHLIKVYGPQTGLTEAVFSTAAFLPGADLPVSTSFQFPPRKHTWQRLPHDQKLPPSSSAGVYLSLLRFPFP
jgi:hypothetical protein